MITFGMERKEIDYSTGTRHQVYAVIINEYNQVAIISDPNEYMLPGGKIEKGETKENALKREIGEETGLDSEVGSFIVDTLDYYFSERDMRAKRGFVSYYTAKFGSEIRQKESDKELHWLTLAECREKLARDHQLYAVEKAFENIL